MEWEKKWAGVIAAAQSVTHYSVRGQVLGRIPWAGTGPCGDCGVVRGQLHVVGNSVTQGSPPVGYPLCDMEQCPLCKGQALSCGCQLEPVFGEAA